MAILEAAFAAFIASSAATIEQHDTDQGWTVQQDASAVVMRAYHKESQTHFMLGCTAGYPVSLVAHRKDGKEGWHINIKVDEGEADQYSSSIKDHPGIAYAQVNTEQRQWEQFIDALVAGKTLKVLTNFSNGATLARYPTTNVKERLVEWVGECEKRGWMF
jgi:hypothetical protein